MKRSLTKFTTQLRNTSPSHLLFTVRHASAGKKTSALPTHRIVQLRYFGHNRPPRIGSSFLAVFKVTAKGASHGKQPSRKNFSSSVFFATVALLRSCVWIPSSRHYHFFSVKEEFCDWHSSNGVYRLFLVSPIPFCCLYSRKKRPASGKAGYSYRMFVIASREQPFLGDSSHKPFLTHQGTLRGIACCWYFADVLLQTVYS